MADIREDLVGEFDDFHDSSLLDILIKLEEFQQKYGRDALGTVTLNIVEHFVPYGNGDSYHVIEIA
jgi:hypothetical protein